MHACMHTYIYACMQIYVMRVQIYTGAADAAPRQLLRQVIGSARSQARAQYVHVDTIRVRVCVLRVFTRIQVIGYNQRVKMSFNTYRSMFLRSSILCVFGVFACMSLL